MKTNWMTGWKKSEIMRARVGFVIALAAMIPNLDAMATLQSRVELGTAGDFVVLAGQAISSTQGGTINGNVGESPGSTFTPGSPAVTINGVLHLADGVALTAQNDLVTAYNDAALRTVPVLVAGGELGGLTLAPGLYKDDGAPVSLAISGSMVLTLDAGGDPNAVWIFQSGSTLTAGVDSRVALTNGAQACNVFWQVSSSATILTRGIFKGNILALSSITLQNLATLEGRALARNAAVSLDNNAISLPCGPSSLSGVPANTNVSCDAIPAPAAVTAANACSTQSSAVVLSQTILPGSCANTYTLRRVWTTSSPCGASLSATQLVFVTDSTAPVLSGVPADTVAACDALPPLPVVTATDNCATGSLTVVLQQLVDAGATATNYTLRRVWSAMDSCGNSAFATQVVAVSCAAPPICGPLFASSPCGGAYRTVKVGHPVVGVWFAITNAGNTPASFTLSATTLGTSNPVPWVIMTPMSGIIPAHSVQDVVVTFNPSTSSILPIGPHIVRITVTPLCDVFPPATLDLTLQVGPNRLKVNDWDGDGSSDPSLYHPDAGMWYTIWSVCCNWNKYQFGWNATIPVPGDFDGDSLGDLAIYFPDNGTWYIWGSDPAYGYYKTIQFGYPGTVPVSADFDGGGKSDLAVYDPGNGMWYWLNNSNIMKKAQFGFKGAMPVPADYDGDGKTDLAVYDPGNGMWYIWGSGPSYGYQKHQFGFPGAIPVNGDFDGDGKADLAVYDPHTGNWYIWGSTASYGYQIHQFGFPGATPVSGDFDGDGISDLAVFYPPTGMWYIWDSYLGYKTFQFGFNATIPTAENPRPGQ
jgi:hypothetical protein